MARPTTILRVHAAVMDLAERSGPGALTMEGIAAEAGVGKQTLYRTWPSVHAVLFDALLAESDDADSPQGPTTLLELLRGTVAELTTEPRATLLRMLAASVQTDETIAHQFRTRLFEPQQAQVTRLIASEGLADPEAATELLLAPLLYRWFLRLPQFTEDELREHLESVRRLDHPPPGDGTGQPAQRPRTVGHSRRGVSGPS